MSPVLFFYIHAVTAPVLLKSFHFRRSVYSNTLHWIFEKDNKSLRCYCLEECAIILNSRLLNEMSTHCAIKWLITLCTEFKAPIILNGGHLLNKLEGNGITLWENWFSLPLLIYNVFHIFSIQLHHLSSSVSGLHFYVFLFYFFCTSALLESALRAAENQAGWEPEPCPLWIKALCQSIPYWGINLKKKKTLCHTVQCLGWWPTCWQCSNADIKGHLWIH